MRTTRSSRTTQPIILPTDKIGFERDLVPAVRRILFPGLSEGFLRAGVRIACFTPYTGGLKADFVGGLSIQVRASIKYGGQELDRHHTMMTAVNSKRPRTFVEALGVMKVNDSDRLLFMEQLTRFRDLLSFLFSSSTTSQELKRILSKVFDGLSAIHNTNPSQFPKEYELIRRTDPYSPRIRSMLTQAIVRDHSLKTMLTQKGRVLGIPCPPLGSLLITLEDWLQTNMQVQTNMVLAHGDPHLRNIMVRRRGRGLDVRFIDPNPDQGVTDPAYDYGKLLHFVEPIGWTQQSVAACRATISSSDGQWALNSSLEGVSSERERRRAFLEHEIQERIRKLHWNSSSTWEARINVSRASAHLGLLSRASELGAAGTRFVLTHAIHALAQWYHQVSETGAT